MPGLDVGRALYGAVLLLAPPRALSALARLTLDPAAVLVARVLGGRELVQAAVLHGHRGRRWQLAGAAVDGAHAVSMLALARGSRRPLHRTLAARNARTAGLLALGELMQAVGPFPAQPPARG